MGTTEKSLKSDFLSLRIFLGFFPHVYSITTCNHVAFVAYYTLSLVSSLHLIFCGDWKWNHNLDQAHFYHSWFFLFCFGLVSSKCRRTDGWMDGREKKFFFVVFIRWCVSSFLYQFNNHIYTMPSSYWLQSTIMKRENRHNTRETPHFMGNWNKGRTIFNNFQWEVVIFPMKIIIMCIGFVRVLLVFYLTQVIPFYLQFSLFQGWMTKDHQINDRDSKFELNFLNNFQVANGETKQRKP